MNETETTFTNIYNENKTKLYRIKSEWGQNQFNLFIIEQNYAWSSEVNEQHLKNLADLHQLTQDTYYDNVKNYICNDHENINIEVKNDQFTVYFQAPKQKLRLKYFFVKLGKADYQNTVELFLDKLNTMYLAALQKLKVLQDENEDTIKQKMLVEEHCTQFVELKRKSDLKMYSAFSLLLNEKKKRICFLTELLEEYTGGRKKKVKAEPVLMNTLNKVVNDEGAHSDQELNLSEGYNTDDEKKPKCDKVEALPSTSRADCDYDFLGGDSPPLHLPKRARFNGDVQNDTAVVDDAYEDDKQNMEVTKKIDAQYDVDTDEDEAVQFNTQDFLDKM